MIVPAVLEVEVQVVRGHMERSLREGSSFYVLTSVMSNEHGYLRYEQQLILIDLLKELIELVTFQLISINT